mmetsp:Transcript_21636/g.61279  ORF Transcript_21636/g.61279 Transcript_21636/m.61279 type:complete len:199 (+) Transcript_21636:87-683(+)
MALSSVRVDVGSREVDVLVDSRLGPALQQRDGKPVPGAVNFGEVVRTGYRGRGKPWEQMTSTEKKIALDHVARKNVQVSDKGRKRETHQQLPDYLAGFNAPQGEWRNWSASEREHWLRGQTDLEEITSWDGPREAGNYALPGESAVKKASAAQGFYGEETDDKVGQAGYVPGTSVPTHYKYSNGYGWDHSQTLGRAEH